MKKTFSKSLSLVMAVLMLFGTFSGLTASAFDLSQPHEVSWDHTLTDRNGDTFTWHGGISSSSNVYGHSYGDRAHTMHDYTVKRLGLTGNNSDWVYNDDYAYAFCIGATRS